MHTSLAPAHAARLLVLAARNVGTLRGLYSEAQARDDHGRWTAGGGDLTPDDKKVVMEWAWPDANPIEPMDYLAMRNPKTEEGKRMTAVLEKLPIHEGVTFRGVGLANPKDVEKLVSAKGYELNLHSSASKDLHTAVTFADAQSGFGAGNRVQAVVLEMHGRGRDINAHLPEELQGTSEVVMMAGTRYKFAALSHEKDSTGFEYIRIKLKEQR